MPPVARAQRGPGSRLRPVVLVAVLVGITAGAATVLYARSLERRLGTEAYRTGLRITRLVADIHGRGLTDVRTLLAELASRPEIRAEDPVLCGMTFSDVLRRSPLLASLSAVTPAGVVFCSGAAPGTPGGGVDAGLLARAVETQRFTAGTFTADAASGRVSLPLLHPVVDDARTVRAVLVAGVDPGALARVAVQARIPPTAVFAVVDQRGTILAHHSQPERWPGQQIADPGLMTRVSTQGEQLIDSAALDGLARFVALTPLPGGGGRFGGAWAVVGVARQDGAIRLMEVGGVCIIVLAAVGGLVSTVRAARAARRARAHRTRQARKAAWDPFTMPSRPAPSPPAAPLPPPGRPAPRVPPPPPAPDTPAAPSAPAVRPRDAVAPASPAPSTRLPSPLPSPPPPAVAAADDIPAAPTPAATPPSVPAAATTPAPRVVDPGRPPREPLAGDDYCAYWGLSQPPFDNSPNPRFLYLSPEHEEALSRLTYAVQRRRGVAMLTGDHGCGKTTVSRALIQRLDTEHYDIALLGKPTWNVVSFLREILYQLGVETAQESKPALLHQLNDVLLRNFQRGRDTVVIVDEAQLIDDSAVFEELRLLLNFQTDDRFLMTLILIGSSELLPKVRRLRHLDQRIAVRFHLTALDAPHTAGYIGHRLATAGRQEPIFTDAATASIFEFTRGTPRMINNVCDVALLTGARQRLERIDAPAITAAIGDFFGGGIRPPADAARGRRS